MIRQVKAWLVAKESRRILVFGLMFPPRLLLYMLRRCWGRCRGNRDLGGSGVHKGSHRVYVLASGSSINGIKDWESIGRHDSIGFNYWPLHNFVPKMYFLEVPRDKDRRESLASILKNRGHAYRSTVTFFRGGVARSFLEHEAAGFGLSQEYSEFSVLAPTVKLYEISARLLLSKIWPNVINPIFSEGTSSVDKILVFCLIMGYEEIVLCGVDLSDVNYFYQTEDGLAPEAKGLVPSTGQDARSIHKTNDPLVPRMGLTVSESIKALLPIFREKGVRLYVESGKSSLIEILPVWKH